jgi:hypothetical protein
MQHLHILLAVDNMDTVMPRCPEHVLSMLAGPFIFATTDAYIIILKHC